MGIPGLKIEYIWYQSENLTEKLVIEYSEDEILGSGLDVYYQHKWNDESDWQTEHDAGAFIPRELFVQLKELIEVILSKEA